MIKIMRIENWRHAQNLAEKLILWGFRGQENATWNLDTTLHRTARSFNHPFDQLWHVEYWTMRQFQRRAHQYCYDTPDYEHKLDWLALMQHYGAPTRLLDFSHSFYVASYFALESAVGDAAVWAINLGALRDAVAGNYNINTSHENIDITNQRHIDLVNEHICCIPQGPTLNTRLVVHVEPERLHERLLIQQGFFLFPCDISKSFPELLAATFGFDPRLMSNAPEVVASTEEIEQANSSLLLKIIIPKKIRVSAMDSLFKANITAATLFPGLDGFGRSMRFHLTTTVWADIG